MQKQDFYQKTDECYFIPSNTTSSATICRNCGQEKMLHTGGEGIKTLKSIVAQEEPKQETLEEVAERLVPEAGFELNNSEASYWKQGWINGFINSAKWQQETSCNHNYILTSEQQHRVIKCLNCNNVQAI